MKLKFGIEVEGGYEKGKDFFEVREQLRKDTGLPVKIKKCSDSTATIDNHYPLDYFCHKKEFKSNKPILDKNIETHIKSWEKLTEKLGFVYDPEQCGTHIHFSPINGEWEDKKYLRLVHNIFFHMMPFTRLFYHRKQTRYCLGNGQMSGILRFHEQELPQINSREELIERWRKYTDRMNLPENADEIYFGSKSMMKYDSSYDTIELRLLPPEITLLRPIINLIRKIAELDKKIPSGVLTDKDLCDILVMYNQSEDIKFFKKYYERWIK